ncbi:hypothetical protein MTsPCn5_17910 [Croceitalea sp. MTPC5]|uniref:hypothetical protein n=1 Tax=Croceitalea sp. MTPC5 TaxID=3056565 RepID=UPI002B3FD8BA|nr:hypothetical protein MTsPCn5_17910 [Croceitalea sp. MTPC5]
MTTAENAKKSWVWLIASVIVSTIVATLAVQQFLDNKIEGKIKSHESSNHQISNLLSKVHVSVNKESTQGTKATCQCPPGMVAISGGFELNGLSEGEGLGPGNNIVLKKNGPETGNNPATAWEVEVQRIVEEDTRPYDITAYAICTTVTKNSVSLE